MKENIKENEERISEKRKGVITETGWKKERKKREWKNRSSNHKNKNKTKSKTKEKNEDVE